MQVYLDFVSQYLIHKESLSEKKVKISLMLTSHSQWKGSYLNILQSWQALKNKKCSDWPNVTSFRGLEVKLTGVGEGIPWVRLGNFLTGLIKVLLFGPFPRIMMVPNNLDHFGSRDGQKSHR